MVVSWGFLIPAGAIIARCFKTFSVAWFNAHRIIQVGLLCPPAPYPAKPPPQVLLSSKQLRMLFLSAFETSKTRISRACLSRIRPLDASAWAAGGQAETS